MHVKDSIEQYMRAAALSRSDLVNILRGPSYYKYWKYNKKESKAFDFGSALHAAILEPDVYKEKFCICPPHMSLATKEGKAWKAENKHKTIIKNDDYEMLVSMLSNVISHEWLSKYLPGSKTEYSYYWNCEDTKHPLKFRADAVNEEHRKIFDIKTTRSLNERKLSYSVVDFGYDIQASLGLEATYKEYGEQYDFYNVWIEKAPPYDILITEFRMEDIFKANQKKIQAIKIYQECSRADIWPSLKPKTPIILSTSMIEGEVPEEEDDS